MSKPLNVPFQDRFCFYKNEFCQESFTHWFNVHFPTTPFFSWETQQMIPYHYDPMGPTQKPLKKTVQIGFNEWRARGDNP